MKINSKLYLELCIFTNLSGGTETRWYESITQSSRINVVICCCKTKARSSATVVVQKYLMILSRTLTVFTGFPTTIKYISINYSHLNTKSKSFYQVDVEVRQITFVLNLVSGGQEKTAILINLKLCQFCKITKENVNIGLLCIIIRSEKLQ